MRKETRKKWGAALSIAALLMAGCGSGETDSQATSLWYRQPAANWNEALPVGNGRLGAMIFGNPWAETLQVNEESLWAGSPHDANADAAEIMPELQRLLLEGKIAEASALAEAKLAGNPLCIRSYEPFGNVLITMAEPEGGADSTYKRSLDLLTGINRTHFCGGGVTYEREVFASAPDNLLVVHLKGDHKGMVNCEVSYTREKDVNISAPQDDMLAIDGQIVDQDDPVAGAGGAHMRFAGRIKAIPSGGSVTSSPQGLTVRGADELTVLVAVNTDYDAEALDFDRSIEPGRDCEAQLEAVKGQTYKALRSRHIADHRAMMERVSLRLGDPALAAIPTDVRLDSVRAGHEDPALAALYFQLGRYLLMGSSRAPGRLPANLQGIWCKDMNAAWNSDYHTNINIQMNYWPAEVTALSECVLPFSHWINAIRKPGRVTASKTFGARGWTVNHLSDPFGHTSISDGVGWGTFPIAGPWLALHLWEHYRFTQDVDYLRQEAYPCMMEAAEFLLTFMIPDKEGHLVTAPSNSPENAFRMPDGGVFRLTYGATMDIEIAQELFQACLKASEVLEDTEQRVDDVRTALSKLPPVRISKRYGGVQEWIEDYEEVEPGHRHVSHLFALYPGTTITPHTPELFDAARKTIERRRKYNEDPVTRQGSYTGWSRAWMINFYARLLDGKEAGANVQALLAKSTLNNLFDTHPPFQIDGNFGGCAGIAEMLLQSHAGELHLLPALPPSWADGEVSGLRGRGGYTVSMKWSAGKLQKAEIRADKSGTIPVRYGSDVQEQTIQAGQKVTLSF